MRILDVNRATPISVFVFAGEDRGANANVGGSLTKTSNWPNISLQERSWRLVGVKVVGNPLTVLWKYMPALGEKHPRRKA
jgi:hypothetical protein